jgi:hypothetical protein
MLADTLNDHYGLFHERIDESYGNWRRYAYEEQRALDSIRKQSGLRTFLGGLAIVGAILMDPDSSGGQAARDVLIITGTEVIRSGINLSREARIHAAALGELGESLDGEVEPMLVEVESKTVKLSGSAEAQYATWRELLRGLLATERGLPVDPNAPPLLGASGVSAPEVSEVGR